MYQDFGRLSEIEPESRDSWERIFLTFDMDWACDQVINDTIDLVEKVDVRATWFVTHETRTIDRLRENPNFELGIHPNFNYLLEQAQNQEKDYIGLIENLIRLIPEAKCLRSHSLLTSTKILQLLPGFGLTHESNIYVPHDSVAEIRPFRIWNEVVRVPHTFEDDLHLLESEAEIIDLSHPITAHISKNYLFAKGLRVLDFHPIHVFLNSEKFKRYDKTRSIHREPDKLILHRFHGIGVRTGLQTLLGLA